MFSYSRETHQTNMRIVKLLLSFIVFAQVSFGQIYFTTQSGAATPSSAGGGGSTIARWNFTATAYSVSGYNNMIAGASSIGDLTSTDAATGWQLITNGAEWEKYVSAYHVLNNGEGGSSAGSPTYTDFPAEALQGGFLLAQHSTQNTGKYPFEFTNLPAGTYEIKVISSIKASVNSNVPNGRWAFKFGSGSETTQTIAQQANYTTPALVFSGTIAAGEKIQFGPKTLTENSDDVVVVNALIITGTSITYDSDASAFFTAAGITNALQKNAVNTLVGDLKTNSLWTLGSIINPVVGGNSTTHAVNLKSPGTFDLGFNGGWTHASTGMTPNGTTGYATTGWVPSTQIGTGYMSLGAYSRSNIDADNVLMSANSGTNTKFSELTPRTGGQFYGAASSGTHGQVSNTDSRGWFFASRTGASAMFIQKNATQTTNTHATQVPTVQIYVGARNADGVTDRYSNREIAFVWVGSALSTTQASTLYTIIQRYQTILGRQL